MRGKSNRSNKQGKKKIE
jgi:hypothetical protein